VCGSLTSGRSVEKSTRTYYTTNRKIGVYLFTKTQKKLKFKALKRRRRQQEKRRRGHTAARREETIKIYTHTEERIYTGERERERDSIEEKM
jgi:hypothetical protein